MDNIKKYFTLLKPSLLPAWLAIGSLWCITRLPYSWQMSIGRFFGRMANLLSPKLRHITETNLKLCFPTLSETERKTLLKKNFESLGIGIIETAMAWWISDRHLKKHCSIQINGLEHADNAFHQGKGIILLSPHFTSLEMVGRMVNENYPLAAMYRPHKNPLIAHIQGRFRQRYRMRHIAKNRMHEVLGSFKDNMAVWYAYDIDAGAKRSVFAPFFGIPTASLTSVSRIAALTGAVVVPMDFSRRDDKWGYEINLFTPLTNFPGENFEADATRLNSHIEASVRKHPEQYIWQYKRFKTRPQGEKRFY
jgi:KDO2-lipid IV(A) lauroyltransferase